MDLHLPPPPPSAQPPARPDLAPPESPRERNRRALAVVAGLVAFMVLAQVGIATWFVNRPAAEGEYAFLATSPEGPLRWNPCQPIHYEVNLEHAPEGALEDVRVAVARVSEATGIGFVEDGTTSRTVEMQVDQGFRDPVQPRFLPLLFEWVPHEHFEFLADTDRAAAFGIPHPGSDGLEGTWVSGAIALDAGEELPGGFGQRYSRGVVLMHELAHVLGLGHVGSPYEIMWSSELSDEHHPLLSQTDWGPGDLEGLRGLGRDSGCLAKR